MKKLKLDLEHLGVESFHTLTPGRRRGDGTVKGREDEATAYNESCYDSCPSTCDGTCMEVCETWLGFPSCEPTC